MVLCRWAAGSSRRFFIGSSSSIGPKRSGVLAISRGRHSQELPCRREIHTTSTQRIFSVQQDRLYDSLHETCKWGATPAYGR